MTYLTVQQVTKVLELAQKNSARDHLMLLLSFQHGLRASEIANLDVQDVQDGRIRVNRVKGSLFTQQPLKASPIALFDEIKSLENWLAIRSTDSAALFPSRKGGHLRPNNVGKMAKGYMLEIGIPADLAHHHSLRHACGSLAIRNGATLEYVRQWLGHKDVKNTIHYYLHINDDEAASKVGAALDSVIGS